MRQGANSGDRSNALWGRGSRGEARSNALWGRGGRRAGALMSVVAVVAFASVAGAGLTGGQDSPVNTGGLKAYVAPDLVSAIAQDQTQTFDVIVQGEKNGNANGFYKKLTDDTSGAAVKQAFNSIVGAEASLTGSEILRLAKRSYVTAITANDTVEAQGYSNPQGWVPAANVGVNWWSPTATSPTIAIVDSGIQANRADFG